MNNDQMAPLLAVLERIAVALEAQVPPKSQTTVHTYRPPGLLAAGDEVYTSDGAGKILQVSGQPHGVIYAVALTKSNEVYWYRAAEVELSF